MTAKRFASTIGVAAMMTAASVFALTLSFQNTWGGVNSETAGGVAVGTDGSIYVAGTTSSFGTGADVGDADVFLLKYAPTGTLVWQRTYGTGRTAAGLRADDCLRDGQQRIWH